VERNRFTGACAAGSHNLIHWGSSSDKPCPYLGQRYRDLLLPQLRSGVGQLDTALEPFTCRSVSGVRFASPEATPPHHE